MFPTVLPELRLPDQHLRVGANVLEDKEVVWIGWRRDEKHSGSGSRFSAPASAVKTVDGVGTQALLKSAEDGSFKSVVEDAPLPEQSGQARRRTHGGIKGCLKFRPPGRSKPEMVAIEEYFLGAGKSAFENELTDRPMSSGGRDPKGALVRGRQAEFKLLGAGFGRCHRFGSFLQIPWKTLFTPVRVA